MNLPYSLDRKYPYANREWIWQFVFPSSQIAKDPHSDRIIASIANLRLPIASDRIS